MAIGPSDSNLLGGAKYPRQQYESSTTKKFDWVIEKSRSTVEWPLVLNHGPPEKIKIAIGRSSGRMGSNILKCVRNLTSLAICDSEHDRETLMSDDVTRNSPFVDEFGASRIIYFTGSLKCTKWESLEHV